jgi:hypothetical protein
MQLSALSFAPNLLQNKAVDTKATLGSHPLTSSKADSFTPSAKIRQGNSEEKAIIAGEELLSKGLNTTETALQNLVEVVLTKTTGTGKHNPSASTVDLNDPEVKEFLRVNTGDEQY